MEAHFDVYEGVILAAGLSKRLSPYLKGRSKVTFSLRYLPMILYPFLSLYAVGVRRFCVVVNKYNYPHVISVFENLKLDDVEVELVLNDKPQLGNGYSLLIAKGCVSSSHFFLSMADHIYPPSIPEVLLEEFDLSTDLVVGGDSNPRFIDVKEATKIFYDGKIKYMGKRLKKYTHVDIGVFLMSREVFNLFDAESLGRPLTVTQIVRAAGRAGYRVKLADVRGGYWTEIDTPEDVREALVGKRSHVLNEFYEKFPLYISVGLDEIYEVSEG